MKTFCYFMLTHDKIQSIRRTHRQSAGHTKSSGLKILKAGLNHFLGESDIIITFLHL